MTEHNYSPLWRDKGFRLYEPDDDGDYRLEIDKDSETDRPAAAVWLSRDDLRSFLMCVLDELTGLGPKK